jgi:hypothetical protein
VVGDKANAQGSPLLADNRCLDDPRNRRLTRGGHPSSMDPGGARAAREYRTSKKVIAITDLHRSRLEHFPDHRFAEAVANRRDAVPCEAAPSSERRCFAPLPSLGLSAESLRLVTHSLDDDSDRSIAPSTAIVIASAERSHSIIQISHAMVALALCACTKVAVIAPQPSRASGEHVPGAALGQAI